MQDGITAVFMGPEPEHWGDVSDNPYVYAIYPRVESGSATAIHVDMSSQTGSAPDVAKSYAYAKAKVSSLRKGLVFNHLTSILRITMDFKDILGSSLGKDAYTLTDITLKAADNFITSADVDITADPPTYSNKEMSSELHLKGPFRINENGKAYIYISLLPGTMAREMSVSATIDGQYQAGGSDESSVAYVGTFTGKADTKAGRFYTATATMKESAQYNFYVKTTGSASSSGRSWETATTMTEALHRANKVKSENPGAEVNVHVAAGTYVPETPLPYAKLQEGAESYGFYISENINIYGSYPAEANTGAVAVPTNKSTILSGDNTSYHTLFIDAPLEEGQKVHMSGINVTKGNSNGAFDYRIETKGKKNALEQTVNIAVGANYGGGVAIAGSKVVMEQMKFEKNEGHRATALFAINSDVTINGFHTLNNTCIRQGVMMFSATEGWEVPISLGSGAGGTEIKYNSTTLETDNYDGIDSYTGMDVEDNGFYSSGIYVSGKGGTVNLTCDNAYFSHNTGRRGSAVRVSHANARFNNCIFQGNYGNASGTNGESCSTIQIFNSGAGLGPSTVVFNKCMVNGNRDNEDTGSSMDGPSFCYAWNRNDNSGQDIKLYVINSTISENRSTVRTTWIRNQSAGSHVIAKFVNTTFANNTAGHSSAIGINYDNGDAGMTAQACVQLISCTITGNQFTRTGGKMGTICLETSGSENLGSRLETYNSLITGNKDNTGQFTEKDVYHYDVNAYSGHYGSFIGTYCFGSQYIDKKNKEAAYWSMAFHPASMLATATEEVGTFDKVYRLRGDARINSAMTLGNKTVAADLAETGEDAILTADILNQDQLGNSRSARNYMGACVEPKGDPVWLRNLLLCSANNVFLINSANQGNVNIKSWTGKGILGNNYNGNISECKPVDAGSKLILTSSNGNWAALFDLVTETYIWKTGETDDPSTANDNAGYPLQAHSGELLPGGYIVIACSEWEVKDADDNVTDSGNGSFKVYRLSDGTCVHTEKGFTTDDENYKGPHGVLYRKLDGDQVLSAIIYTHVYNYEVNDYGTLSEYTTKKNKGKPVYNPGNSETKWIATPHGNHDLILKEGDKMIVAGHGIYEINRQDWKWIGYARVGEICHYQAVKSVNYNPYNGEMFYTRAPNIDKSSVDLSANDWETRYKNDIFVNYWKKGYFNGDGTDPSQAIYSKDAINAMTESIIGEQTWQTDKIRYISSVNLSSYGDGTTWTGGDLNGSKNEKVWITTDSKSIYKVRVLNW